MINAIVGCVLPVLFCSFAWPFGCFDPRDHKNYVVFFSILRVVLRNCNHVSSQCYYGASNSVISL
jgi:hypothetical protein